MRKHLFLATAVLLGMGLRLLATRIHFVVGTDEAAYLTLGLHLARGHGFTLDGVTPHTEFAPGYPLLAAAIYRLVGQEALEAPSMFVLMLGGLLPLPIYALTRAMWSERAALRAGFLTALLPALALGQPNFEAPTEQITMLLVWSAWWLLWLGLQRPIWLPLVGLLLGFGHLARWEVLQYALLACLPLLYVFIRRPERRRGLALGFAGFVLAFALSAVPYARYLHAHTGRWTTPKGILHQFHGRALDANDPLAFERSYEIYEQNLQKLDELPSIPVWIWQHREEVARRYARNVVKELRIFLTTGSFLTPLWLPFALFALWRGHRSARKRHLFLALTLAQALILPLAVVDPRYLLPLLPAGLIWASLGLSEVERRWSRPILSGGLAALFLAASLFLLPRMPRPVELKSLGLAARAYLTEDDVMLARKRQPAFYAGAQWAWLPVGGLDAVYAYADKKGAKWLVFDSRYAAPLRPDLVFLIEPTQAPPSLTPLIVVDEASQRAILYRIADPGYR